MTVLNTTQYTAGTDTYSETTTQTTMSGAVRNDVLETLASTDNEIAPLQVNMNGALYTMATGIISSNNSTTSNLTVDEVYTGSSDIVTNYSSITINIIANQSSANEGMEMQFSSNNSNWDIIDKYTIVRDVSRTFHIPVHARYFRIVYTNGSIAQTAMRLQTMYHGSDYPTESKVLGVDIYKEDQTRGLVIGAVRTDTHGTLTHNNKALSPLQVNDVGELRTESLNLRQIKCLLDNILKELKISNMYNSVITDVDFNNADLDETK
jgi:hypothetical protein